MKIKIINCGMGLVGVTSLVLLLLLSLALITPTVPHVVQATDCQPGEAPCTTTLAETNVDLMVASTVSVALESQVQLEVIPRSSGAFTSSTSKLTVATNNPSGYAVYMQANQSQDGKASLVSSDLSNPYTIAPVEGQVSGSSFQNNTWGYSLDGDNYQAVPATTSLVKETTTTTFNDTYDLSFGVQVDTNLPAGQYTNSVIISAVANPIEITSLNQLTYMQDMTSDICTNTAENITKQLIDTRDGKSYWVAKLKDGNCWMTQNLALDLSTSRTLTPADTDVTSNYTPTSSTNEVKFDGVSGSVDSNSQYSWNMGKIVLGTPLLAKSCPENATFFDDIGEICRSVGFVNVSGSEWFPTFTSQAGTFNGESSPLVSVDETSHTYDAHYLIGNYYQYNAITAGTGSISTPLNGNASSSICPKGWQLPTTARDDGNGGRPLANPSDPDHSFYRLLLAYGYPQSAYYLVDGDASLGGGFTVILNRSENTLGNLAAAPFYLVRSSMVYLMGGFNIRGLGVGAFYPTSTGAAGNVLSLSINSTYVLPAFKLGYNYYGQPVRCVAR